MSDCIFCKIASGDIPSKKVFENEDVIVFHDIDPKAPVHVLIVPKKHSQSVNQLSVEDMTEVLPVMYQAAKKAAAELGVHDTGYRLVVNTGEEGGQTVAHLHMHLLGGRCMQWPPG